MSEHQARKRWIKLWTQETLHGTTLNELEPPERAVWFELLCLAGDSVYPGKICITEEIPYTDEQLSKLLKVNKSLLAVSLTKLQAFNKINRNGTGIIEICNWAKYQGTFDKETYMAGYIPEYRAGLRRRKINCKTNDKSNNDKSNK